jgi:cob(I)alamin adenosyltransferase
MKIYTKTGDKGTTALVGGKRVNKSEIRIEAYGTVDELISQLGWLRDQPVSSDIRDLIIRIQDRLMVCAAILATETKKGKPYKPELSDSDITELEDAIDRMEKRLPSLTSFVIPGGHPLSSAAQISRTVCRRAERRIVELSVKHFVPEIVLHYINRLSDFLFVLSRKILYDNQGVELKWKAGL